MVGKTVIDRLKALFRDSRGISEAEASPHDAQEMHLAAAALMVEAATMDDDFDARERAAILGLVIERFGLSPEEGESLIETAAQRVAGSSHLFEFTRVVKHAFAYRERVELLEMLWEVAYSDAKLHHLEANLIRRVTGLLHVSDRDSGAARKRALERTKQVESRPGSD